MPETLRHILASESPQSAITVRGWVRTKRESKSCAFLEITDGSCFRGLQAVVDATLPSAALLSKVLTGASVEIVGDLIESPAAGQKWELQATELRLLGEADASYPLQKKGHTPEFLRTIAHLRPRTNLFSNVFRVRSRMAYAVHRFFQERGFFYVHTPIITSSDCEGAGELFRVTTLKQGSPEKPEEDFFGQPTYLTVSGQLQGETFACALGNIYTFGPTFRAENSNTARHAAEFWMIEPEMAFCDLFADMTMAEEQVKYLVDAMLTECPEELEFFNKFVDKELVNRLKQTLETARNELKEKMFVSPEAAERIMNKDMGKDETKRRFFGIDAIKTAFDITLNKKDIPPIPWSTQELQEAHALETPKFTHAQF